MKSNVAAAYAQLELLFEAQRKFDKVKNGDKAIALYIGFYNDAHQLEIALVCSRLASMMAMKIM